MLGSHTRMTHRDNERQLVMQVNGHLTPREVDTVHVLEKY